MLKKGLSVGTILLVGILHLPAVLSDWYFFYWWYDVMMHTLGGVAMGCVAMTLFDWLRGFHATKTAKDILLQAIFVVGFVAMIGIGWEWAEALADAVFLPHLGMTSAQLGLVDTMLDLYFDLCGGALGWIVLRVCEERKRA